MTRRRLLPRRLAALLASVALVSVTARPVLACDMGHDGHRDAVHGQAADPHAGHDMTADQSASDAEGERAVSEAPPSPRSSVPACDHVVGCAVMVLSSNATITAPPASVMDAAPRTTDADVDAPTLAVEPPPPRR